MDHVIDKPQGTHKHGLDAAFDSFDAALRESTKQWAGRPVFRTNIYDLFSAYLAGFSDPIERQYHNCSCCRHFLNHYANLAVIVDGNVKPFVLSVDPATVPAVFQPSLKLMQKVMAGARITSRFYYGGTVLGTDRTGEWTHFWVPNPARHISRTETAGQAMAKSAEEFRMLLRAVLEFDANVFARAAALLVNAKRVSSDKFRAHLDALVALKAKTDAAPNQGVRDAYIWESIAANGSAFAHVRSAAIGTLLSDLAGGMADQDALNRFTATVDPMRYGVPTSAPKAGNIKRAEEIIADLGLAASLQRRYADVTEVAGNAVWAPSVHASPGVYQAAAPAPAPKGVFAGLTPKGAAPAPLGVKASMTWERFAKTILPRATHISIVHQGDNTFGAMTTAVDPTAPPIFAWDQDDARNPLSWYRWNAVAPADFHLYGETSDVAGIVPLPSTQHPGVILLTPGAQDSRAATVGIGLFADLMRSDLREVRHTLYAHSTQQQLGAAPHIPAVGLVLRRGFTKALLRVTVGGVATDYAINGWE